jgi:RNA polymerase sigma-70 factor (ECF subfamily)
MLTFHKLYERHAPDVYRFACWLSGDPAEAEDITSETFVRAWSSSTPIRTETVRAYLFAIARNVYLQGVRRSRRQAGLHTSQPDPAPGPDQVVADRIQMGGVARVLMTLPEVDRAALIMRAQYDMPYDEIARALGLSISAAKVKVHRARLRLIEARMKEE